MGVRAPKKRDPVHVPGGATAPRDGECVPVSGHRKGVRAAPREAWAVTLPRVGLCCACLTETPPAHVPGWRCCCPRLISLCVSPP